MHLVDDEYGDGMGLHDGARTPESDIYPRSPRRSSSGPHAEGGGPRDEGLLYEEPGGRDELSELASSGAHANGDALGAAAGLSANVRWTTNRPHKAAFWAYLSAEHERSAPGADGRRSGEHEAAALDRHQVRKLTGVPPRDLRVMDPSLSYPSSIMIRERALVVNLEHVKAIITSDFMLLQQLDLPSVTAFLEKTRRRLADGTTAPPEPRDDDADGALRSAQPRKPKGAAAGAVASLSNASSRAADFFVRSGAISATVVGRRPERRSEADEAKPAPRSTSPGRLPAVPAAVSACTASLRVTADAPGAPAPGKGLVVQIPRVLSAGSLPAAARAHKAARANGHGDFRGLFEGNSGAGRALNGGAGGAGPAPGGGGGGGSDGGYHLRLVVEEGLAFELRALECCLQEVVDKLCNDVDELARKALPIFDSLTRGVNKALLETARRFKTQLARLENKVENVHDALEKLLDSESELHDMCLTRKRQHAQHLAANPGLGSANNSWSQGLGPAQLHAGGGHDKVGGGGGSGYKGSPGLGPRRDSLLGGGQYERDAIEDVENCIEAYFEQIDGAAKKLDELREYISNAEDYVAIELDSHRNQLIQLDATLTIATLCVSCYALVGSLFGMNMRFVGPEEGDGPGPSLFKLVTVAGLIGAAGLFVLLLLYCRRLRLLFV